MDKHFDVIIIGSGAGGGTLAKQLAPSGKSILLLERGDWLKREAKNWDTSAVFEQNRYVSACRRVAGIIGEKDWKRLKNLRYAARRRRKPV